MKKLVIVCIAFLMASGALAGSRPLQVSITPDWGIHLTGVAVLPPPGAFCWRTF